jgi:hypothetical protein
MEIQVGTAGRKTVLFHRRPKGSHIIFVHSVESQNNPLLYLTSSDPEIIVLRISISYIDILSLTTMKCGQPFTSDIFRQEDILEGKGNTIRS